MVWERVAKFESGALYAEMYLLQNQSRGNRKKKERGETGRKGSGRPPPPELRQIKGRDGGRFDRRKKNARITKQIDETIKQSIVRLMERKGEQRKCCQVVYLKRITFYPPFRPLDGKARVVSCRRYFIIRGKKNRPQL